jgi:hypothetical protein
MKKNRPLGPKICFFMVSALLAAVMGYVVISCLYRERPPAFIDVAEISSQKKGA